MPTMASFSLVLSWLSLSQHCITEKSLKVIAKSGQSTGPCVYVTVMCN